MDKHTHQISSDHLTLNDVEQIAGNNIQIELSDESIHNIQKCYDHLAKKMAESDDPIYGINTGFGSLYKVKIDKNDLTKLQENLIRSHACGTGSTVPLNIVKLMIFLKIQSLSYGHSGVNIKTVQRLSDFYNKNILPVVYTQGSLGASGDLAPLAHLSLPLLDEGEVFFEGTRISGKDLNKMWSWAPVELSAKEGLALLNGTQFMSAYGVYNVQKSKRLSAYADIIGTISLEAFDGRPEPFDDLIHEIRNQPGQRETAAIVRHLLNGSEIIEQAKTHVQDPYSFRCIPQVHGASKDAIKYVEQVFENEINAVTDNPNIFPDDDKILSGGNFHGQPLALALDHLGLAVSELGSISERRIYQLISGLRGLPDFLVANPGLNSGLMIPQYTAASIASQNKQLCTPASADSIVSSNGQEDHVSMGANAATKAYQIIENTERILAIELLNASQALEFRRPLKSSSMIESFIEKYRKEVPIIENDRFLHEDINRSIAFLQNHDPWEYLE